MSFAFPCTHSLTPAPISTPLPDEDADTFAKEQQTPSPHAVNEFTNVICAANRSDVVSDLISDHLVTEYVRSDDDAGSTNVSLPELFTPSAREATACSKKDSGKTLENPAREEKAAEETSPPPGQPASNAACDAATSLAPSSPTSSSPNIIPQPIIGPERKVLFYTESLGIKLSRHTDGYVRVLSVSPYRPMSIEEKVRDGEIHEGDLVREVCDVDLRKPIDSAIWKLTVGLIKMAPRPLEFVVATEYEEVFDVSQAQLSLSDNGITRTTSTKCEFTGQTILPTTPNERKNLAPTRQIVFYDASLGVKLQHTSRGYVVVNSVVPVDPSTSPPSRTGELKPGDIVLEVGGVWDLYHPISINAWGILVKFIRECRRPMRMVVADENYLTMMSPCSCSDESMDSIEEEDERLERDEDEKLDAAESKAPDPCNIRKFRSGFSYPITRCG